MKLSIVITLYQSESYLPKCMESVLNQDISKSDYEIILVNDGSPDNSLALAREYAERYDNVVVLSHPNKGLAGARNTGLEAAHGKYLCFIDPDDYIETNSLSSLLEKMECDNLDMLRFNYQMVDEEYTNINNAININKIDYSSEIMDGQTFLFQRLGYACFVWAYIYSTALIKDNQIYFTQGDYFDDTDWLPRVLTQAKRIDSIDIKRYYYLQRKGSLVQTTTLEATKLKLKGLIDLIVKLSKRKKEHSDLRIKNWYERMVARSSVNLLKAVSIYFYDEKDWYISVLKENDVFPLSYIDKTSSNKIKIVLINNFPIFYCWLIHKIKKNKVL